MGLERKNIIYFLISFWMLSLLTLASWWGYLAYSALKQNPVGNTNVYRMFFWEGTTFLAVFLFLSFSIAILIFRDIQKNRSLQIFFASLGHELKTPIASIKLQTQFLKTLITNSQFDQENVMKYIQRLESSTFKLENEFEQALSLARVLQNKPLHIETFNLYEIILLTAKEFSELKILVNVDQNISINFDTFLFKTILRNLFSNSLAHNKSLQKELTINQKTMSSQFIELQIIDNAQRYSGDIKNLGKLFYKQNSSGSGIGLFLIKKILEAHKGYMEITNDPNLCFHIFIAK